MDPRPFGTWRRVVALGCLATLAPAQHARPEDGVRPPNIVLVVLDTVRWDAVSFSDAGENPTPALARLAEEGFVFTQAFSPSDHTLPAHFALFTGLADAGAHNYARSAFDLEGNFLPTQLEALGYETLGIIANPILTRWVSYIKAIDTSCVVPSLEHSRVRSEPAQRQSIRDTLDRFDVCRSPGSRSWPSWPMRNGW